MAQSAFAIVVSIKKSNTTVEGFKQHIQQVLPSNTIKSFQLSTGKGQKLSGRIIFRPSVKDPNQARNFAHQLRASTLNNQPVAAHVDPSTLFPEQHQHQATQSINSNSNTEEAEDHGALHWKNSKSVAAKFFDWLHQGNFTAAAEDAGSVDLTSVDREKVHQLFELFSSQHPTLNATTADALSNSKKKQRQRLESLVMSVLRAKKLCKTQRYSDGVVVCSFARMDKTFAPVEERKTARDILRQQRGILVSDKGGIQVETDPTTDPSNIPALPINQMVRVLFPMETVGNQSSSPVKLTNIYLGGSRKKDFQVTTSLPCVASLNCLLKPETQEYTEQMCL